jgi:hypothetical protein
MTASLLAAGLWVLASQIVALNPSRANHWPQAWALIALGLPILGWLTYETGPLAGLLALAAGASILRWPLRHLWRWARRRAGRGPAD